MPKADALVLKMLLDLYVLKKGSEELLTLNAEPGTTPPQRCVGRILTQKPPVLTMAAFPPLFSYVRRVNQSMQKLDPLLKTLQVRTVPPEGLVQAYLIHIGDRSDSNFKKILDLKGVRRQEQAQLIELFQAHRASPRHSTTLVQQSPLLTPLNIPTSSLASSSSSAAASSLASLGTAAALSTPSLQARFDPATLGLAIMSVARDGVDLFGAPSSSSVLTTTSTATATTNATTAAATSSSSSAGGTQAHTHHPSTALLPSSSSPSVGTGHDSAATAAGGANGFALLPSSSSASGSPNLSSGNLQENLRNIGRFFKRDLGAGFSGRFGAGGGGSRSSRQDLEDAT